MKADKPRFGLPAIVSIGIHLGIIILMIMAVPTPSYRLKPSASENQPIVHAAVIDSAAINDQVQAIQNRETQQRAAEQQRLRQLQAQAEAARQSKLVEEQRLTQIKLDQQKAQQLAAEQTQVEQQRLAQLKVEQQQQAQALAQIQKQQLEVQAKALALKKQQEDDMAAKALAEKKRQEAEAAKILAVKKQADLAEQQKVLQQQLMQQQIANEHQQLVKVQQMQGLIDQYRARILMAIGKQWLIPEGADPRISCVFTIDVTPAGAVSHAQLIHSSGNAALDRSAETAIYKASPLSVPKDPSVFEQFRHFTLKMTPQDIAHNS